jgi:hypothetical protein
MGIGNIGRFRPHYIQGRLGYIIKNISYFTCLLVINMANLERGNLRGPCLSSFFIKKLGCGVGGKSFYSWIHKSQKLNNVSKYSLIVAVVIKAALRDLNETMHISS